MANGKEKLCYGDGRKIVSHLPIGRKSPDKTTQDLRNRLVMNQNMWYSLRNYTEKGTIFFIHFMLV